MNPQFCRRLKEENYSSIIACLPEVYVLSFQTILIFVNRCPRGSFATNDS